MTFELANFIHVLIIWLSLMFFFVLLTPKFNKKKSNKFLALILLTIGLHFVYNFLYSNNKLLDTLPAYSCSYGFLYGPLLYFYVKFSLNKYSKFKWSNALHFLPLILIVVLTSANFYPCATIKGWVIPVMLLYCTFSYYETLKYKRLINQITSKAIESELRWINLLILIMFVIIVLNGLQMQVQNINVLGFELSLEVIVQIGVLVMVTLTIFQGLKNPTAFQQLTNEDIKIIKSIIPSKNSDEFKEDRAEFAKQLEAYMNSEQPFLEPNLTLDQLSNDLKVSPLLVSQTIKQEFKTNFSDYINTYRIDYSKELLLKSSETRDSIKEIMYDSGFNSRSVFNTTFKRKIGVTPSQFKKNNA